MRRIGGRNFLHNKDIADRFKTGATVLLGNLDTHEAEGSRLANGFRRKFAARVKSGGNRHDLVLRKFTCGIPD